MGLPLCITSDMDKLTLVYDSNKIALFDLINRRLHDWTRENMKSLPKNWL